MLITRTSILTGKTRTYDLDVTPEQLEAWNNGTLIQVAMPHLTVDEQEFIMTGAVKEEWDEIFGDDGDEDIDSYDDYLDPSLVDEEDVAW